MPMININNCSYYFEIHGKGIPVVLIAGLRSDHSRWFPVLEKLAARYKVLIFDNRGSGQTTDSGEPFTVEVMAADTMSLIARLGFQQPHIIGHSLGGAIAQYIAKNYSDKISSIALCNTFLKLNDVAKEVFKDIITLYQAQASPGEITKHIASWVFSNKFLTPSALKVIQRIADENLYPQSLSGYTRQLDALCNFDSRTWLRTINLPTLVIGSAEDKIATPRESEELTAIIRGSRLVILTTGHGSLTEAPDAFMGHLNSYYDNLASIN